MKYRNEERCFKDISHCSDDEKSFLHKLLFPDSKNLELYSQKNIIAEVYVDSTGTMMGGYVAELMESDYMIHLINFDMVKEFKSRIYGRNLMYRAGYIGVKTYGKNFKGIIAATESSKDHKNIYKHRYLFNTGGRLIIENAKVKNNQLHLVYIPYNGGQDCEKVKEIFQKLYEI